MNLENKEVRLFINKLTDINNLWELDYSTRRNIEDIYLDRDYRIRIDHGVWDFGKCPVNNYYLLTNKPGLVEKEQRGISEEEAQKIKNTNDIKLHIKKTGFGYLDFGPLSGWLESLYITNTELSYEYEVLSVEFENITETQLQFINLSINSYAQTTMGLYDRFINWNINENVR